MIPAEFRAIGIVVTLMLINVPWAGEDYVCARTGYNVTSDSIRIPILMILIIVTN